uniref:Rho-GAP domain-containing protein n=1 Tax=Angiostrongylus cantonensis TaxID=6313 RepID=A0A0K0DR62_ANGCA
MAFSDQQRVTAVVPVMQNMGNHCFIPGNTVTSLCIMGVCMANMAANVGPIPPEHLMISGRLTTTNVIMANWSRQMWQSVLDRVARRLSSGPFATNFSGVFVTIT